MHVHANILSVVHWVLLSVGRQPTPQAYFERGALFYNALTQGRQRTGGPVILEHKTGPKSRLRREAASVRRAPHGPGTCSRERMSSRFRADDVERQSGT